MFSTMSKAFLKNCIGYRNANSMQQLLIGIVSGSKLKKGDFLVKHLDCPFKFKRTIQKFKVTKPLDLNSKNSFTHVAS